MNNPSALLQGLSEEAVWRLEEACCRFEQAWQAGGRPLDNGEEALAVRFAGGHESEVAHCRTRYRSYAVPAWTLWAKWTF